MTTAEAWTPLSPALRTLRRAEYAAIGAAVGIALGIAGALLQGPAGSFAGVLPGVALAGIGWTVASRQWRAWGYCEREGDLLVRRGVLVRRLSVVPYGRMQFVDIAAGPLDRRLGIATVHLHTAAASSDARLPGLPTAEAERMRDRLTALGEARAAGL